VTELCVQIQHSFEMGVPGWVGQQVVRFSAHKLILIVLVLLSPSHQLLELTNSMEQPFLRSWRRSACKEILRFLWNLKVCYRVHKNSPKIHTPSRMNPSHTLLSYFLKIYFNIVLSSTPDVFQVVCYFQAFQQKFCAHFTCPLHVLHAPPISFPLIWSS
jgi:hypothetical protein